MSIHVILGEPGAGKTTFASILALEAADAADRELRRAERLRLAPPPVRQVYANFPMFDDRVRYFDTWQDLKEVSNAWVFLDESSQWFSRRNWQANTDDDLRFFRQHRKDALTLFMLAHGIADLESKIVNELASTVYFIRRLLGPALDEGPTPIEQVIGWWSMATRFKAREFELSTRRQVIGRRLFRLDKNFQAFDSYFVVGGRNGGGRRGASVAAAASRAAAEARAERHPLVSPDSYADMRTEVLGGSVVRVHPHRIYPMHPADRPEEEKN